MPHHAPLDVSISIPTVTASPLLSDLTTLLREDGSECTCTGPSFTTAFPEAVFNSAAADSYRERKSTAQHKKSVRQKGLTRLLEVFVIIVLLKVSANIKRLDVSSRFIFSPITQSHPEKNLLMILRYAC
jgi:hypothetical protein